MSDQWDYRPDGMPQGLKGDVVMRWLSTIQCDAPQETYRKLKIMVAGAVTAIAEQREDSRR